MNEHTKEHLERFAVSFKNFSNHIQEMMEKPFQTAADGYKLHALHEATVIEWMGFLQVTSYEEMAGQQAPEPGENNPPKPMVN